MPFGHFVPRRGEDKMANRFTASTLLLLAGICVSPTRPAATDGQEKKQGATRPAISQEVAPLEAIVPVAKDGNGRLAHRDQRSPRMRSRTSTR